MSNQKIVTTFPKLSIVRVIESRDGYFLESCEKPEILYRLFTFSSEIVLYVTQNYLILSSGVRHES